MDRYINNIDSNNREYINMDNSLIIGILIPISLILNIFSGICKAICDLSEEKKIKGNPNYWVKDTSWKNKWKNGDKKQGERFFGSSRWFVMFTDAWHLFGFLERISFIICSGIIGFISGYISLWFLFGLLINYILFQFIFHLFHDTLNIFKK
jgi:hypothetical protein